MHVHTVNLFGIQVMSEQTPKAGVFVLQNLKYCYDAYFV